MCTFMFVAELNDDMAMVRGLKRLRVGVGYDSVFLFGDGDPWDTLGLLKAPKSFTLSGM